MKTKKNMHWWFGLLMAALILVCSLSIPGMAESMIEGALDQVKTDETTAAAEDIGRETITAAEPPAGHEPEAAALASLEEQARKAFAEVFSVEIPADYKAIDSQAYEEEGFGMIYILTLMPSDWSDSMDALAYTGEKPFYTAHFGSVDLKTGEAKLLGLNQFRLGWNEDEPSAEYSKDQIGQMEAAARAFAQKRGYTPTSLTGTGTVAGSFIPGCSFAFSTDSDGEIEVFVSALGEVNGYSLIVSKG